MRKILLSLTGILMLQISPISHAGGVDVNVILAGEVQPGVYGRVELGNTPRPQVVYARPRVVEHRYVREVEPIYLHVPPEHARHWDRHCRYYDACGRPVYFVRSVEYEPGFNRREYDRREHERHEHYDHDRHDDDRHDHDRHDRDDDHDHHYRN